MQKSKLQLKDKNISKKWELVRLKEVIDEIISGEWGRKENGEEFVKCKVLRGTDFVKAQKGFFEDVPIRFINKKLLEKLRLKTGDILVELSGGSKDQPTGRVFIWRNNFNDHNENIIFSNFIKKLILNTNKVFPEYFYRYWQLLYLLGKTTIYEKRTTGIRNFKYCDFIENEKIPLPPLPIQQKIVEILDTVRGAVETQEKIIELTKELKKSLLNEIFNSKIKNQKSKLHFKIQKWVKLGEYCEKPEYGYTTNAIKNPVGPKFLRITDIQDEKVNWEDVPFCECEQVDKYLLGNGDILIARIGATTGKTFLIKNPPKAVFASYLIRVRTKRELIPDFLNFYFQSPNYWIQINKLKGGKLKGGINIPILQNLKIPLPSLPEQQEIAEILQTIDQKIEIEQKKKALYEELFGTMLNQIISQKINVEKLNV